MSYRRKGGEILANSRTEGSQLSPRTVGLSSGNYVVLWLDTDGSNRGQVFDSNGNKAGPEFISEGLEVAATHGGGFISMWGDGRNIFAQRHGTDGTPVEAAYQVNSSPGDMIPGSIAVLASGAWVITWDADSSPGADRDIRAQLFSAGGVRIGPEFDVNDDSVAPGRQFSPEIAALTGGGFVIAWESEGAIRAQIFAGSGPKEPVTAASKVGAELAVSSETRFMENAQVAALASGGFVIVWTKNSSRFGPEQYQGIYAQIFDAAGNRVGGERVIAPEGPAAWNSLDVTALPDGGFAVAWASNFHTGRDSSGTAIKVQVLDAYGNEIGPEQIVNTTTNGNQVEPALTGLAGGGFAVSWADGSASGGDTDGFAIRSQIFIPDRPIEGTTDDDTLIGTRRSETILGGEGNDVLWGGAGSDALDGGEGGDYMEGGLGDDVYNVDDWCDTVEEFADQGIDEIRTALGTRDRIYTLPDHVENLTGTSGSGQAVAGNSLDNVIVTGAGNDLILLDDCGDEVVAAGAGNDVLYFGNAFTACDFVDGGSGNDTLALQGNYGPGFTFGTGLVTNMIGIEGISLLSGSSTLFGDTADNRYDYHLKLQDSNVAPGVQFKINGGNLLEGEDLTVDGSAETDGSFLIYGGKGVDILTGGAGNDVFFFAHDGRLGAGDHIDGGAGIDGLFIRGNFSVDFNDPAYFEVIRNVENITLTSVTDTRYARSSDTEFDYDIVTDDGMAAAGRSLTINGGLLQANETMNVDAHHESDAFLRIFGGASDDTITGGALADTIYGGLGADLLKGNGGSDIFSYISHSESTAASRDHIQDLTIGDKIDLSRIDADGYGPNGDGAFTFIGSAAFSSNAGQLRAENVGGKDWLIQADRNGDGVADMEILVTTGDGHMIGAGDFFL